MAITLVDLAIPSLVGASTGLLIVFLVLKNFSPSFKIKIAGGGFLTALAVAALYYVSQSMLVGVLVGTAWAFGWLFVVAEKYSKDMPDREPLENPFNMKPHESAGMSAMMLTIIVFVLGSAASVFAHSSNKISVIGFSAPPLLGAISFVMCSYFITRFDLETDSVAKQLYLKKLIAWWTIGQTILISTIIAISFFVAVAIEAIVAA